MLTKGDKDSSQPWENPETGARGSVTPLSQAYSAEDGRTCRDFLASYVNGRAESWLQGAALQGQPGPMGSPHDQTLDAGLRCKKVLSGVLRGSCKNATGSPDEAKAGELP